MIQYIRRIKNILFYFIRLIINLYIPNIRKIMGKKLIFNMGVFQKEKIVSYQRVKVTGKGVVRIGKGCSFGYPLGGYLYKGQIELQPRYQEARIEIGDRVETNNNIFICCKKGISIGDDCLIGHNVEFMDFDGHPIEPSQRRNGDGLVEPILIGKNVWFGNNVMVLRGTQIGDNSIVAAGAVVKGKFGSNVIIGGVPAKVIRTIDEDYEEART